MTAATLLFCAVVALGLTLAAANVQEKPMLLGPRLRRRLGAVHGLAATAALALLLLSLRRPPSAVSVRMGAGHFGLFAALLFGAALLTGLLVLTLLRRRSAVAGPVIALHAVLALAGFLLLLTFGGFA